MEEFDYDLPQDRIAQFPLKERDDSKLLCYRDGTIIDHSFKDIVSLLPAGSTLVMNNTKVINARLFMYRETGAKIQLFLLAPVQPKSMEEVMSAQDTCVWNCMIGGGKRWKEGESVSLELEGMSMKARLEKKEGMNSEVSFHWGSQRTFGEMLEAFGKIPLPPYMRREAQDEDQFRYQTTYASVEGSVAAPTAGLHFTDEVLNQLNINHINLEEVTLHVGAGTFKPVDGDDYKQHEMHAEWISVRRDLISHLSKTDNLFCVGTTSLRTLESLYWMAVRDVSGLSSNKVEQWDPYQLKDPFNSYKEAMEHLLGLGLERYEADTSIMITPEYRIRSIEGIVTNFHMPKSTLLLLVYAVVGKDWKNIYSHALNQEYRFLSFGDSSLLFTQKK
ncbi:MAG: S-adenosylmethionine:tRNA ribosyltransferase-isomerase [Flavobacteriales bacterium]|nr:S-adenosylmethionine:tRNA ribosyltransferase-isomerase [Flavobacteriales bacterium]